LDPSVVNAEIVCVAMVHSVPQRLVVISMFCVQLSKIFALDAIEPVCVQQGQCSRATLLASGISTTKVLTFVPQTLSPNITRLDITGNSILTFTGTELNVYSKLEEVYVAGSSLAFPTFHTLSSFFSEY
jgi:hypothetical protein